MRDAEVDSEELPVARRHSDVDGGGARSAPRASGRIPHRRADAVSRPLGYNPHVTPLSDHEPDVEVVDCHYPLIHQSNNVPAHFLHAFPAFLNQRLGLRIRVTDFKGDIHIGDDERTWFARAAPLDPDRVPFWLIVSGGKRDYTVKWWDPARHQQVVDHFRGRIQFVQVGEASHHHPSLDGVIDLRGATTPRQLVRLMYHAEGAISPISLLMHLAALSDRCRAACR